MFQLLFKKIGVLGQSKWLLEFSYYKKKKQESVACKTHYCFCSFAPVLPVSVFVAAFGHVAAVAVKKKKQKKRTSTSEEEEEEEQKAEGDR
jgi:hypothetical protein